MPCPRRAQLAFAALLALLQLASCQDGAGTGLSLKGMAQGEEDLTCEDVTKLGLGDDMCEFVQQHCSSESLIDYPRLYYCHVRRHGLLPTAVMVVLCTALLVLLFRIIARAADDYFSCILSQISQDLGLPPRLGGVTLLALGNGAPDLSSCIAAVKTGNYKMALGALTGAGMFVGGVVAGRIITLNGGVRARGAQIRDISSQFIAVAVVTCIVASGWFTYGTVALLLSLYASYVVVVAVADFSKRLGVEWGEVAKKVQRRMSQRWSREMVAPLLLEDREAEGEGGNGGGGGIGSGSTGRRLPGSQHQLPAVDEEEHLPASVPAGLQWTGQAGTGAGERPPLRLASAGSLPAGMAAEPAGSSSPPLLPTSSPRVMSLPDLQASRRQEERQQWQQRLPRRAPPVAAFQPHVTYGDLVSMPTKEYRQRALAEMAQSRSFYRRGTQRIDEDEEDFSDEEEAEGWEESEAHKQRPREDEEQGGGGGGAAAGGYQPPVVSFDAAALAAHEAVQRPFPAGAAAGDGQQQQQGVPAGLPGRRFEHQESGGSASTHQFSIASMEVATAAVPTAAAAGAAGGEGDKQQGRLMRALEAVQWPVLVMLQATIPLVEVNNYQRPWFLRSLAASPLFIVAYLRLFSWQALLVAAVVGGVMAAAGHLGTQQLQGKAPLWTFGTGYPIGAALVAVYGFGVAAMWIALFASEIVGLLQFFGLLSKVEPAILGVTVLAWGNSLMDYLNNTAMAGKSRGGNSMAMTACFAGPLFNMLVGLGLGFWALLEESHEKQAAVQMDPVVLVGCVFILINCATLVAVSLFHRQWLPRWCGWAMVGCYAAYLASVVAVLVLCD